MATTSNWKSTLAATDRYENIARLCATRLEGDDSSLIAVCRKKCMEARGLSSTGNSHKAAFAAETEAYDTSESREAYEAACNALTNNPPLNPSLVHPEPTTPGISIGPHQSCHLLASGLVSQVYRSSTLALKVITETHNVEPHNPAREIQILRALSHPSIITLTNSFRDQDGRLVLAFPFQPFTLAGIISNGQTTTDTTRTIFKDVFSALAYLHSQDIIHRDVKPSNILLSSPTGPALLADFGTAWHPALSLSVPPSEPPSRKILEVGTTCYRAPETLFGNASYNTTLDLWSTGAMLAECLRSPPTPLFESRDTSEDGNQLGLILSMFKTLGTPTRENWPEAENFGTPPFKWYNIFPGKGWEELLPGVDSIGRDLIGHLVKWESGNRLGAKEALEHPFFKDK